ncbi:MAG TPA: 5-formyltetrahydrofolate cyclo-ligase [Xanthomonadaceae bacterium]|jgi:5-formyltetrahydrofolate cyclo-ligase|nr:5-formyltetrahydrofolate cyclo-ligase [Xanthomonadaceae bacterium]
MSDAGTLDAGRELRRGLRESRAAISAAARIAAAANVANRLLGLPTLRNATSVAGYWAVGGELPLHILMTRLAPATRYCLPILHQPDRTLRFAPWRVGDPVIANRYNIPEPAHAMELLAPDALDVVLLPLLGYTRRGDRVGTGGGWYDRSFAFRRESPAPPLLIGVGFACQQIDAYAANAWDVPLDAVVTERELLLCPR